MTIRELHHIIPEGDEFLDSIVTGDETWGFHHTSAGRSPFALRNHMTESTSHLAGLWIGAAISNTSNSNKAGSTTVKRARFTGKGSSLTAVLP